MVEVKTFVRTQDQARLSSLVAPSTLQFFIAVVSLMVTHGIGEHLIYGRSCNLFHGIVSAEKSRREKAAGYVAFLVEAMYLVQKNSSALAERQSVKRMMLHLVSGVPSCSTDQKRSFLCTRRENDFIVDL